jgi:hypothetical protein
MRKKLALAVTAALALTTAALASEIREGNVAIGKDRVLSEACGYSAGGIDTAWDDAFANANRACIAKGCKGAIAWVSYQPWTDAEGYTHVCIGYYCDC